MRSQFMLAQVRDILADAKGREVRLLDVRNIYDITDFMVVVNGTSSLHVVSMAEKLIENLRAHRCRPIGVEGKDVGDWVLIDFGDVIIHVMRPQTREFYNLEKLWGSREQADVLEM